MRVTGGEFCSRVLKVPSTGEIRPTQDRVRESLFATLAPELGGSAFLDLFAGSGSVGIEAVSRGAASVTFVESSAKHISILEENLGNLKITAPVARVVRSDVLSFVSSYSGEGFDIVFADPPYALWREDGCASFLKSLSSAAVIRTGGLFVAEVDFTSQVPKSEQWDLLRDKMYGKTRVLIWRRIS